jgi:hypothetical protein
LKFGSTAGRLSAFATARPSRIQRVILVSFVMSIHSGLSFGVW